MIVNHKDQKNTNINDKNTTTHESRKKNSENIFLNEMALIPFQHRKGLKRIDFSNNQTIFRMVELKLKFSWLITNCTHACGDADNRILYSTENNFQISCQLSFFCPITWSQGSKAVSSYKLCFLSLYVLFSIS